MRQLDLWTTPAGRATTGACAQIGADTLGVAAPRAGEIARRVAARLGRPVHVTVTRNRSTMLSYRERDGILRLRLHELFLRAGEREVSAIAEYVAGRNRTAARVLDAFVAAHSRAPAKAPAAACRTNGRFHDLQTIFDELNETYFHGAVAAGITWGSASTRRYRRTIQLGVYVRQERLIRIHPCLDQAFVPRHYLTWIVFHEMLHDVFGIESHGGRRRVHPPEFTAIEQSYPDYVRCRAWEQRNMHRLLRFRSDAR